MYFECLVLPQNFESRFNPNIPYVNCNIKLKKLQLYFIIKEIINLDKIDDYFAISSFIFYCFFEPMLAQKEKPYEPKTSNQKLTNQSTNRTVEIASSGSRVEESLKHSKNRDENKASSSAKSELSSGKMQRIKSLLRIKHSFKQVAFVSHQQRSFSALPDYSSNDYLQDQVSLHLPKASFFFPQ